MTEIKQQDNIAKKVVERSLIVPTNDTQEEIYNQVSIIKGLSTDNELTKIHLRLKGFTFDNARRVWIKTRKPIMNEFGIGNFMATLQGVSDMVNFSYYESKDIPKLAYMFFADNYPVYLVYSKDFELDPKDFNVVKTILQFWALSVLNNAKNAGHRNVVRGTLSEGILAKALGNGGEEKKKGGLFSFLRRDRGLNG